MNRRRSQRRWKHPTAEPSGSLRRALAPPEATPAAVRAALLPEDVPGFDREYREAMAAATRTFDLALVHECVQRWRLVAWSSADPDAERGMRQQADRLRAGKEVATISLEQLKELVQRQPRVTPLGTDECSAEGTSFASGRVP